MYQRRRPSRRPGAAVVEFAVVFAFVMIPVMIGVWEVGRLVYCQQIVANSAREGARLAAQGRTINTSGAPTDIVTQIPPASNPNLQSNVKAAVLQTLHAGGLTNLEWDDVTVTFQFLDYPAGSVPGGTEPYQGIKNQRYQVSVTIPFEKVRWIEFGLLNPTTVSYTVDWRMLMDDPFTVNTTMPTW
jgi:Flp pilus assembly protein TadG